MNNLFVTFEQNNAGASSQENGVDSLSPMNSEKAVQEMIKPLVQGTDDHLIEFSEVMRSMPMFTLYMSTSLTRIFVYIRTKSDVTSMFLLNPL